MKETFHKFPHEKRSFAKTGSRQTHTNEFIQTSWGFCSATLSVHTFDSVTGELSAALGPIGDCLPEGFVGEGLYNGGRSAADLHVHPNGRW